MSEKRFIVIPRMTGEDGEVAISLIDATFQEKDDSTKKYPDPEFGSWLFDQISKRQKSTVITGGFFKKKYSCPSCSSEVNPDIRKPVQISLDLKYLDFAPLTVEITLPCVECPECKAICEIEIKNALDYHIGEALIHAFETQKIKP